MRGKYLGLNGKALAGVILLGVIVFIYFKRKGGSTAKTATGAADGTIAGVDEGQLATDVAAQLAASLGGTQAANDPNATQGQDNSGLFAAYLAEQQQSLQDFLNSLGGMTGAGISYSGGSYGGGNGYTYPGSSSPSNSPTNLPPGVTAANNPGAYPGFISPNQGTTGGGISTFSPGQFGAPSLTLAGAQPALSAGRAPAGGF